MDIEEPYMDSDWYVAGPPRMKVPETADSLEAQAVMNPMPVAWLNLIPQDDGQSPEANGQMIVHRVNAHEGLVRTLEHIAETAERHMKQPRPDQDTLGVLWQDMAKVARDAIAGASENQEPDQA